MLTLGKVIHVIHAIVITLAYTYVVEVIGKLKHRLFN